MSDDILGRAKLSTVALNQIVYPECAQADFQRNGEDSIRSLRGSKEVR